MSGTAFKNNNRPYIFKKALNVIQCFRTFSAQIPATFSFTQSVLNLLHRILIKILLV